MCRQEVLAYDVANLNSTLKLGGQTEMPLLGVGVFRIEPGEPTRAVVRTALEYGYRLIDTARVYCNERSVGRGWRDAAVPRDRLFITTKLWRSDWADPRAGLRASLERLQTDYVDLFLLHWPFAGFTRVWRDLEQCQAAGLCRAIGVSNFKIHHLQALEAAGAKIMPQVNQTEIHPVNTEEELTAYCRSRGIVMEAYSPLGGEGRLVLDDPRLLGMCAYYRKTPAQIILRWDLQRGVAAIPKSAHSERLIQNSQLYDFSLSEGDLATISDMNRNERRNYDPDRIDSRPECLAPHLQEEI